MFLKKTLAVAILASASSAIFAQGLVLNDQNLRTDLNWLVQQGVIQISTSTWPMSGDEIERAISQAKISNPAQQKVVTSVKNALQASGEQFKVAAYAGSEKNDIPQAFGDKQKAQYVGSVEFNAGGEHWDAKIRANVEGKQEIKDDHKVNLDGSYVGVKYWNQWLTFGQIPTYWGPGHDGSLLRGDASRSVVGFSMQRNEQKAFESKWLSWIGPWQYQIFGGQLKDYSAVPDAKLMGMRLTASPLPFWEIGVSRTFQIGGEGQPDSFKAYWNALIGNDNGCDNGRENSCVGDDNASNQLAGFDTRINLAPLINLPISLYGQAIGEDERHSLPQKYFYLAGADFASSFKGMPYSLYAEWADTRNEGHASAITYNHHQYKDGYYQQGYPLGHPLGGDGEMYSFGGDIRFDAMNRLGGRVFVAHVNESDNKGLYVDYPINDAFPEKDKIKGLDLTWTHYLKPEIPLKINGWVSDSDKHGNDSGASIGIELPLDLKSLRF